MFPLRRLLQRELLVLIGLFAGLSAVLVWVGMGRSLEQQILVRSRESLGRLSSELTEDLVSVERVAGTAARWWQDGRLTLQGIPAAEPQLASLLEEFPQVANLVFISVEGMGLSMSRLEDGLATYHLDARQEQGLKRYLRKAGRPLAGSVWEPTPYRVFQRPWWKEATLSDGPRWVDAYRFANLPTHGISYAIPLRDALGHLQGVICVDIFLRTLSQHVWAAQPTPHAQVLVSDPEGVALILPRGPVSEEAPKAGAPFLRRLGPDFLPLFQELLQTWEAHRKEGDPFRLRFGGEGYTCIAQPLLVTKGVDWRLSLAIPDQDVQGPARRLSLLLLLSGVVIMGLAAWRALHLARRFSAPLERLAEQAQTLGEGDLPGLVETGILEIRALGLAFQKAGLAIQAEAALQRQLLQSQRVQVLGTLSGGIAHDVNNQLAAIVGQLDLGRMELPEAHPTRHRLDLAEAAAHRCSAMVRSLLRFTHQTRHEFQTCDLNELVRNTGNLLGRILGGRIQLGLEPEPGLPPIQGDPVGLEQVLMNLAVNARDAMPHGGQLVIATSRADEATLRILVKDTGQGIPEAILPRIFEPFFSTKAPDQGNGLGLAMVAGIVRAHDGRIDVQSRPGAGTEVSIFLPIGLPSGKAAPSAALRQALSLNGRRILVVEDDATLRDLLVELLAQQGGELAVAQDGAEGWRRLSEEPYDLLICDQRMPHLTGLELLALLRAQGSELPVILISGHGLEGTVEDPSRDLRLRILAKPFGIDRLLAVIRELL